MDNDRLLHAIADCSAKDYGFMVAFTEGRFTWPKLGFGFLAFVDGYYISLNAITRKMDEPFSLRLNVLPSDAAEFGKKAVTAFLSETASDLGVSPEALAGIMAQTLMPLGEAWHFVGIVNGEPDREDNLSVWRAMWGRIIELVHSAEFKVVDTGRDIVNLNGFKKKLLYEALNGQIVLDR